MLYPRITPDSKTQLYGIFGNPVRHSLSPLMHNVSFWTFGINGVYLAFEIEPATLQLAFEAIRSLGMGGVNLTIPFKEDAMDYVDEVPEDLDRRIGAINTVVNRDGKLLGYNTDSLGFLQSLREDLSFNPEGKTAMVLGAGGAARGVIFSLAKAGATKIVIHNRTIERGQGLAHHVHETFPELEIKTFQEFEQDKNQKVDLLVNATSLGMIETDPMPFDLKFFKSPVAVFDLVYKAQPTPLLKAAESLKWPHVNGLPMLANQGALAFALWTGRRDGVKEKMKETLKQWIS